MDSRVDMMIRALMATQANQISADELEAGEVLIGDELINDTMQINNDGTPQISDYIWGIRLNADGTINQVLKFTAQSLIDALDQDVSDMKDAVAQMKNDVESAKTSVESTKQDIDQLSQGLSSAIMDGTTAVESAGSEALSSISDAKTSALAEINGKIHPGYRAVIGDGTTTEFTITHNLGCDWVIKEVWFADLTKAGYYEVEEIDENSLKITFQTAPEANGVEVRIISSERVQITELGDDVKIGPENLDPDCFMSASEIAAIIGE